MSDFMDWVLGNKSYPGHKGRPGKRGGSLPRSGGAAGATASAGDSGSKKRTGKSAITKRRRDLAEAKTQGREYRSSIASITSELAKVRKGLKIAKASKNKKRIQYVEKRQADLKKRLQSLKDEKANVGEISKNIKKLDAMTKKPKSKTQE